jgi:hypothetical protein
VRRGVSTVLCGLGLLIAATDVVAQGKSPSPQTEVAVLEFARSHHAELAGLLESLKNNAPHEYRSAIVDLDRTRERLERSQKSNPERYALELAEWKASSRIRLLAARLAMGGDTTLEAELKVALRERYDLRLQLLQEERLRLQKRVAKLDESIAEQERRRADLLEKEFATLQKGAGLAADRNRVRPSRAKIRARTNPARSPQSREP